MSDSPQSPAPDDAPPTEEASPAMPAESVPESADDDEEAQEEEAQEEEAQEVEMPDDPVALAADRAGFKFLAVGFAIFFAIIAICATIVALVMKSMGI